MDYRDHHRVGAGVMLGVALGAAAHLAAAGDGGGVAADGAKPVPAVPAKLRPRLRHNPRFGAAEILGGGSGVLKSRAALLHRAPVNGGYVHHEVRQSVHQTQKDGLGVHIQPPQVVHIQPSQGLPRGYRDVQLPHREHPAGRANGLGGEPLLIAPRHFAPIHRVAGENVGDCLASIVHSPIPLKVCRAILQQYGRKFGTPAAQSGDCRRGKTRADPNMRRQHKTGAAA